MVRQIVAETQATAVREVVVEPVIATFCFLVEYPTRKLRCRKSYLSVPVTVSSAENRSLESGTGQTPVDEGSEIL